MTTAGFLCTETFEAQILSYTKQKKEDTKHRVFLFGSGKRLDRLRRLRLADSPLRTPHASRAVLPSRFRLKVCRRHISQTPKPSQVRILLNGNKKEASTGWHLLLFGSGKRIRTSTYGVRVRCATITQYRYVQFQIASGIIQCSKGKVKPFFRLP